MKTIWLICGFVIFGLANTSQAQNVVNETWTVDTAIPEGSPVGITESDSFDYSPSTSIVSVNVYLDISGGYNGNLYGYLTFQNANGNTATEILLNQIGTSLSNPFGSSGSGMNVTLSDAGTANGSIHNASGMPTGIWQPDSANALNGTFGGLTANGTWTLFLADTSVGGGTSTLESWGLEVTIVPEPSTIMLFGMGASAFALMRRRDPARRSDRT
jgi:subtilisin-like proprotein convertase family protein